MMRRYEPKPWDIRRCDMIHADEGEYVLYCDAQAEIERLTKERDEARAQVAFSQMEMRDKAAKLCSWHSETLVTTIKRLPIWIDAQSAFEAYGREKVREGMMRAAGLVSHSAYGTAYWAILADMEKLK